ncbi:MAG: FtsW/RodA/SpoVE family cell cycle protein, partial [Clostridia bacterium]|nr:FtsW/RodA/SpoVE family cell cycle protein [Clostridia bacterium]
MDQKRRSSAHREYDRLVPTPQSAPREERPEAELPRPSISYATRAHTRASAAAFDGAGLSPQTVPPAGEAKIDEILRANPQRAAKRKKKFVPVDVPFFMLVFGLLCFGLIMMYSASYAWAIEDFGNPHYYIGRQAMFAVLGVAIMIVAALVDYTRLKHWLPVLGYFLLCVVLLIMVIIFGNTANGAKRWVSILGITFQPSEFAKFAVIYALAWLYSIAGKRVRTLKWGMLPLLGVLAAIVPLIVVQKHI